MKDEDKIENLPSYSKLRQEIEGADSLRKFVKFLSVFGFKDKGLNETLNKSKHSVNPVLFSNQISVQL